MKGRTTCPKCNNIFIVDASTDKEKIEVACPKCNNEFIIKPLKCDSNNLDDCTWEEYGEPRKTILSSIKPKTSKPLIASFLLIAVFVIGVASAAFPDIFFGISLEAVTDSEMIGTIEFDTNISSIIIIIFSLFALIAAVMTYKRKHLDIVIISAILAIFSFGFFFTGSIFSIISLFIILKSREEFDDGKKGKEF